MQDIEIEVKVKIEKIAALKKFLKKNGKLKSQGQQIDEYFTPLEKSFLSVRPIKEWLRLRVSDGKYSINYKNWHYKNQRVADYCDEYETKLEKIDQIKKILHALGFTQITVVDKERESWIYKDYEISIDQVKNLGDFVEIEYIGKTKVDPSRESERMISFLRKINCGKITRNYIGYPWLLLFPDESDEEEK